MAVSLEGLEWQCHGRGKDGSVLGRVGDYYSLAPPRTLPHWKLSLVHAVIVRIVSNIGLTHFFKMVDQKTLRHPMFSSFLNSGFSQH